VGTGPLSRYAKVPGLTWLTYELHQLPLVRFAPAVRAAGATLDFVGGGVTEPGQSGAPGVDTLPPPEIYDPATGTFGPAGGNTVIPRIFSSATLLPDGKVLIAGGMSASPAVEGASNQGWRC